MENIVKEELSKPSNSYHTEQQDTQQARYAQDRSVGNSQLFSTEEDYITDVVDEETICCTICAKSFSSKEAFVNHVSMEHNEGSATEGPELWSNEQTHINYYDALQTVKIETHEEEHKAEIISFQFSNKINSISEDVNYNTVRLEVCSPLKREEIGDGGPSAKNTNENLNKSYKGNEKVLVKFPLVTKHELTDSVKKLFACDTCNYKSNIKSNLRVHIKTHTGEKPFACVFCDYKSIQRHTLRNHIYLHTGEKPFACNVCDYKCSQKGTLENHIYIHTGEKPLACKICDYKCGHKKYLNQHIKKHTDEKQFACNICDYKCIKKSNLKVHIKTHTGEKPFACKFCDYKCSQKGNLRRHISIHTGEKPFVCNICDHKFSQKSKLTYHITTHR